MPGNRKSRRAARAGKPRKVASPHQAPAAGSTKTPSRLLSYCAATVRAMDELGPKLRQLQTISPTMTYSEAKLLADVSEDLSALSDVMHAAAHLRLQELHDAEG